ncbi:MAG TPA: DUF2630 family protein [Cellulomonas sp.]
MTSDLDISHRIGALVDEEKQLREQRAAGAIAPDDERTRLSAIEVELDQCWDLLRQRAALRDAGSDPGQAAVRPAGVVENYQG